MTYRTGNGLELSMADLARIDHGSCASLTGLTSDAIQLFTLVVGAGETGLTRSHVPKGLKAGLDDAVFLLELKGLVTWERDNRGKPSYLVLTWKGQEAFEAAKPRPNDLAPEKGSLLARRGQLARRTLPARQPAAFDLVGFSDPGDHAD